MVYRPEHDIIPSKTKQVKRAKKVVSGEVLFKVNESAAQYENTKYTSNELDKLRTVYVCVYV